MKILFVISALTLFIVGCNKTPNEEVNPSSSDGLEKQEADHGQTPGFEKEKYRNNYKADDANITTPIDSRPDLEEEE